VNTRAEGAANHDVLRRYKPRCPCVWPHHPAHAAHLIQLSIPLKHPRCAPLRASSGPRALDVRGRYHAVILDPCVLICSPAIAVLRSRKGHASKAMHLKPCVSNHQHQHTQRTLIHAPWHEQPELSGTSPARPAVCGLAYARAPHAQLGLLADARAPPSSAPSEDRGRYTPTCCRFPSPPGRPTADLPPSTMAG